MENGRQDALFIYLVGDLWRSGNYKAVNQLYTRRFLENVQKAKDVQERIELYFSSRWPR